MFALYTWPWIGFSVEAEHLILRRVHFQGGWLDSLKKDFKIPRLQQALVSRLALSLPGLSRVSVAGPGGGHSSGCKRNLRVIQASGIIVVTAKAQPALAYNLTRPWPLPTVSHPWGSGDNTPEGPHGTGHTGQVALTLTLWFLDIFTHSLILWRSVFGPQGIINIYLL